VIFSNRTPEDLSPNAITRALEQIPAKELIDLTQSNPTLCGFDYPEEWFSRLSAAESLRYQPHALGDPKAREAVAHFLTSKGQKVHPDNVVLTASTSEAYSFLFKLFADPGDTLLIPTPGYPLLDHLAALEGLKTLSYPLQLDPAWPLDLKYLRGIQRPGIKAFITINPHNPTGALLSEADRKAMAEICAQNQWVVISDEVFEDYLDAQTPPAPWNPEGTLSFRLGGLSKSLGLPQLKLSWMILQGPEELLRECKDRLELIADTYLSVNTPVQKILPNLLPRAGTIQKQIQGRLSENRSFLAQRLKKREGLKLWPSQGGWVALVEILEKERTDEAEVLGLLEKQKVLVHPGGFYDFPAAKSFLVISLLPQPALFHEGIRRLEKYFQG
jgi:aspartate/methionine/tyrosine aminotransferase